MAIRAHETVADDTIELFFGDSDINNFSHQHTNTATGKQITLRHSDKMVEGRPRNTTAVQINIRHSI